MSKKKSYSDNLTTNTGQSTVGNRRLISVEEFGELHPEAIIPFKGGWELIWAETDGGANIASCWEEAFNVIACECLEMVLPDTNGRVLLTEEGWHVIVEYAYRIKQGESLRERFIWFTGGDE